MFESSWKPFTWPVQFLRPFIIPCCAFEQCFVLAKIQICILMKQVLIVFKDLFVSSNTLQQFNTYLRSWEQFAYSDVLFDTFYWKMCWIIFQQVGDNNFDTCTVAFHCESLKFNCFLIVFLRLLTLPHGGELFLDSTKQSCWC